ncbi:MAG: tRNA (guanosine(46)-N7)-methyltransferase TrmB [Oscillospiraceae bacterium]|nr:tRNA (guanosine(46)-N7)-methyltransferase TrmB [Oscillospiraceae bacterium]
MRMRKKPNMGARMERCDRVWIRDPQTMRGNWRALMPEAKALRIEVGCGKGKFTAESASAEPEVLFIAMERVQEALVMAMEKAIDAELQNVFYIDADVANILELFAPDEADLLYINFCDPWTRKKAAKRRLTHHGFLEKYKTVLKQGGQIYFKTDNAPLFDFSLQEFESCHMALANVTRDLHANGPVGIMTGYEEKFYAMGTPICRLEATVGVKENPFGTQDEQARDGALAHPELTENA